LKQKFESRQDLPHLHRRHPHVVSCRVPPPRCPRVCRRLAALARRLRAAPAAARAARCPDWQQQQVAAAHARRTAAAAAPAARASRGPTLPRERERERERERDLGEAAEHHQVREKEFGKGKLGEKIGIFLPLS